MRIAQNVVQAIREKRDMREIQWQPGCRRPITGALATDGDAANENTDTIDGFSSYSTSDSDGNSQAANGEVGGDGCSEGLDGRLEAALLQTPLLRVRYFQYSTALFSDGPYSCSDRNTHLPRLTWSKISGFRVSLEPTLRNSRRIVDCDPAKIRGKVEAVRLRPPRTLRELFGQI